MKRGLLLVVLTLLAVNGAYAQPGVIGLFSDPSGANCHVLPTAGLVTIYVVHINTQGATAVRFSAPKPNCWTGATYLADSGVFAIFLGTSQTGVTMGYGACLAAPIHILSILYFEDGTTPADECCLYQVFGDPRLPGCPIEMVDCSNILHEPGAGAAIINPTSTCNCLAAAASTAPSNLNCPIAVEETTWGAVKAIYGR